MHDIWITYTKSVGDLWGTYGRLMVDLCPPENTLNTFKFRGW